MRTCNSCKIEKSESDFYIDKRNKSGLQGRCKLCMQKSSSLWKKENSERNLSTLHSWRRKNKEYLVEYTRDYYLRNLSKRKSNPRIRELVLKRQKTKPSELDILVFEEAVHLSNLRNSCTGIKWHIDHIVPLRGKTVCGLHNGINIQVIPASVNLKNRINLKKRIWNALV